MSGTSSYFVAVKAETNRDLKVARRRVQHTLEMAQDPSAVVYVATVLVESAGPNLARRERVAKLLQQELADITAACPGVTVHVRTLSLIKPSVPGSYTDVPRCKAELLCSEAASLQCQEIVIGGQNRALRDSPAAAFWVGHSTRFWILKRSTLPVYLAAASQTVMPGGWQIAEIRSRLSPQLSSQPSTVAAAA